MKKFIVTLVLFSFFSTRNFAQQPAVTTEGEKILVDNSKIKVTEFVSLPNGSVCGKNNHSHGPHLTVILTDAEVEVTTADGKKMIQKAPAGTTFWSESETHAVKNIGKTPLRIQIIETKN